MSINVWWKNFNIESPEYEPCYQWLACTIKEEVINFLWSDIKIDSWTHLIYKNNKPQEKLHIEEWTVNINLKNVDTDLHPRWEQIIYDKALKQIQFFELEKLIIKYIDNLFLNNNSLEYGEEFLKKEFEKFCYENKENKFLVLWSNNNEDILFDNFQNLLIIKFNIRERNVDNKHKILNLLENIGFIWNRNIVDKNLRNPKTEKIELLNDVKKLFEKLEEDKNSFYEASDDLKIIFLKDLLKKQVWEELFKVDFNDKETLKQIFDRFPTRGDDLETDVFSWFFDKFMENNLDFSREITLLEEELKKLI